MVTNPQQGMDVFNSFRYGEISRSFWGEVRSEVYALGAKWINNFICYPSGAVRKRLGTQYLTHSFDHELYVMDGKDIDVVFRKNSTTNVIDFATFRDGTIEHGWTTITEPTFAELKENSILSSDGEKIVFAVQSGLFSLEKSTGTLTKLTVNASGDNTINDFSKSVLFENSLVVVERDKISASRVGDMLNFVMSSTSTDINDAFQTVFNTFTELGTEITNVINYKGSVLITTSLGIFSLKKELLTQGIRIFRLDFITTNVVPPKCIVNLNSHLYFSTDSGLWTFRQSIGKLDSLTSSVNISDSYETILLTSYCSHVFDYPIIQLSKRKRDYPSIIYGLRTDGTIINFTIHPQQVAGNQLSVSVSRRTCEGKYLQVTDNFFSSCVSERIDRSGNTVQFAEKEIFSSFLNDNRVIEKIEDNFYMQNRSFYDCSFIKNGWIDDKGILQASKDTIKIEFPTHKQYTIGDKLELDGGVERKTYIVVLTNVSTTDNITTLTVNKTLDELDALDTVYINGKKQDKFDDANFNIIRQFDKSQYSYILFGSLYTHEIRSATEANNSGDRGIFNVLGIGYDAFVRMLPSSYYFEKTMPLSARIVTADTNYLATGVANRGDELEFYTYTHYDTDGYHVDIPTLGDRQHMDYEYYLVSKIGHNCVIMSVNYENIRQNLRDY